MAINLTKDKINAAKQLFNHPLFGEIFDDLERTAFNNAVNAKPTDDITPSAYLAEVRCIRAFRSRLEFIITSDPDRKGAGQ